MNFDSCMHANRTHLAAQLTGWGTTFTAFVTTQVDLAQPITLTAGVAACAKHAGE